MLINTTADKQMYRNLIEESKSKGEKILKLNPGLRRCHTALRLAQTAMG